MLVFKNNHSFPVEVFNIDAIYNSVQGETRKNEFSEIAPNILQPGEIGYAATYPILDHIEFAEDFAGSDIIPVVEKEQVGNTYTRLQISNLNFSVNSNPYSNNDDLYGDVKINGIMKNTSNINVDGDRISTITLLYDSQNKLIGGFPESLGKTGKRLHPGEQFDFQIESNFISKDLASRIARIEVVAGCEECN